jgi:hypothetical protein
MNVVVVTFLLISRGIEVNPWIAPGVIICLCVNGISVSLSPFQFGGINYMAIKAHTLQIQNYV